MRRSVTSRGFHPISIDFKSIDYFGRSPYLLLHRIYALDGESVSASDEWVLECSYEEIGAYPTAMAFSSQQRVGLVLELWDEGEGPVSPQPFIQALGVELDRLSVLASPVEVPVSLRT